MPNKGHDRFLECYHWRCPGSVLSTIFIIEHSAFSFHFFSPFIRRLFFSPTRVNSWHIMKESRRRHATVSMCRCELSQCKAERWRLSYPDESDVQENDWETRSHCRLQVFIARIFLRFCPTPLSRTLSLLITMLWGNTLRRDVYRLSIFPSPIKRQGYEAPISKSRYSSIFFHRFKHNPLAARWLRNVRYVRHS